MTLHNLDQPGYDHTQPGTAIRVITLVVMLWVLIFAVLSIWVLYIVAGIILLVMALFNSLNVRIDGDSIQLRFGTGLLQKSIPLESVESCRSVRNSWLFGFGIRYVFDGWMWNVSGLDAVQLTFTDGKHFRIGTDDPAGLESAIKQAIDSSGHNDTAAG